MAIVLLMGTLLFVAAAVLVARKGLRPLRESARAIHNVAATPPDERTCSAQWPKELAALANAFEEMLGRLEGSFIRLSQSSPDLAHELRTPINNLVGEAEITLGRARTAEEYRQVIESSQGEFARLSRMIDSLLFLARAETADPQVDISAFDRNPEFPGVL